MPPAVLIADNDSGVNSLLTEVLHRRGLLVQHAFDGEVARVMARHASVGVLVCDLDMPRASGLEVLESLSDMEQPPLSIVVSGYLDASLRERLQALPYVCEILRKPFDLLKFAARVDQLLAASMSRRTGLGTVAEGAGHGGPSLGSSVH